LEDALLYKTPVSLGSQLPVRLDAEVDKRLAEVAELSGTTKSALIRMLAKTFVDQCVEEDGTVTLPANWRKLLGRADGRAVQIKRQVKVSDLDASDQVAGKHVSAESPDNNQDSPSISPPRRPRPKGGRSAV
jgi:predicted DNA-binding protein